MKNLFDLRTREPDDAKLNIVVGIGIASPVMMRNFEGGSNRRLQDRLLKELRRVFAAQSKEQYWSFHSDFCHWGMENIEQTKRNGGGNASYGQIAKTLDVAMKVIVYYCHYPDCQRSKHIQEWLNAAVDTEMMSSLKATYYDDTKSWPSTLKDVDGPTYASIQSTVRRFIKQKHHGSILPVQFDDMYWEALNRQP